MNFCVAILILKMKENKQHFWLMHYYFKKGKNTTEMQKKKICAVYGEGDRLIKYVKSRLWIFMLDISHWTMLHGWVDELKLIEVKSRHIENNQHYTMREIANILKISKSLKLLVKMKNVSFILWKE